MLESFENFLRNENKSENTIKSYIRHMKLYFNWFEDSFGSEFKKLYRENILDYKSFLKNIKKDSARTINAIKSYINERNSNSNYLFVSRQSNKLNRTRVNQIFNKFSDKITPHKLRHFWCTHALESGYSVHEVANQAGHSNIHTTLIYTNPSKEKMKEKANLL